MRGVALKDVKGRKLAITSAFIPVEGTFQFRIISKEEAINLIKNNDLIGVFTSHQTIKVLGLKPCQGRPIYNPELNHIQLWIKPKGRLEFGKEYTLDEIEAIGYDIWVAIPV